MFSTYNVVGPSLPSICFVNFQKTNQECQMGAGLHVNIINIDSARFAKNANIATQPTHVVLPKHEITHPAPSDTQKSANISNLATASLVKTASFTINAES